MNLDAESQRKLGERRAIGRQCIELAWGRPWDEIHPEDRESAATDAISDILTVIVGPAGSWKHDEEERLVSLDYHGDAGAEAGNLLDRSRVSWLGDAEDYTERVA